MSFYDRLVDSTETERMAFMSIPLIVNVVSNGASRELYGDFLDQAYHHVRHTCPLLEAALERCGEDDGFYRSALKEYIAEEIGHDEWILDDIRNLEADAYAVRNGNGRLPCRAMVAYAYYLVEKINPYALLGMVHVLEGMSVALAQNAASAVARGFGDTPPNAFSYLTSHGALDIEHVDFFKQTVNTIEDKGVQDLIIEAARDFYKLYGDVFRDLGDRHLGETP